MTAQPGDYIGYVIASGSNIEEAIVDAIGKYRVKTGTMPKTARVNLKYRSDSIDLSDLGVQIDYVNNVPASNVFLGPQ